MPDLQTLIQGGSASVWLYVPVAILLGALHGLEPGHSKTMMAAFIIAIRGTVGQAVLLGLSATISHTLVIWLLAALALNYSSYWDVENAEPYFQIASAALILGLALWMFVRTRREVREAREHDHHGPHRHGHSDEYAGIQEMDGEGNGYQDAHERAHARDIAKRFAGRSVTTPQIVLFGITGGLMPCPAAFTILLVCLQVKRATLGFALVGAFSFGLALTMVAVGAVAAWSVHHAQKRFSGFGEWMRRAPYISCAMLVLLSVWMAWGGWQGLRGHSH